MPDRAELLGQLEWLTDLSDVLESGDVRIAVLSVKGAIATTERQLEDDTRRNPQPVREAVDKWRAGLPKASDHVLRLVGNKQK